MSTSGPLNSNTIPPVHKLHKKLIKHSKTLFFDDATKIITKMYNINDVYALQSDINSFIDCCINNGMKLNTNK